VPQFVAPDAALVLLGDILARGKSSRLYRKLVVDEGLAQDVSTHQAGHELAGTFNIVVTLRPDKPCERASALVGAELEAILEQGVSEEELTRVQNNRLAGFVYALDNIGGFGGVADRLNAYNTYLGDPGRITTDIKRYLDVAPADLSTVVRQFLVGQPRVSLTVRGGKAPGLALPLDRSAAPLAAPAVPFRAPAPEQRLLRSGMPLWVIPRRELPIVAATVVVPAGAGAHAPDRGGLAGLTAAMMDEGTTSRTSLELATAAESMGTNLSTSCGWDGAYVSVQCLTPHLEASLDLAVDVLCNPSFPPVDWKRVHAQTLAALRAERDSAEARAYRALLLALYGAGHPYRTTVDGDEASVSILARDQILEFYHEHYRPGRGAWVVAGDVDPDEMAEAFDRHLGDRNSPAAPLPDLPAVAPRSRARLLLLDRPGSAHAAIRVGHVGLPRLDPDYIDALVLNQILGGQFTSRLNRKLREEKGLTYGVRSYFDFRRGAGPFSISASVQTERVAEALDELRRELLELVDDQPPTMHELDDARRALIEGQARQFETPAALVARYASLFLYDLPPDYHARFPERLDGITVESLAATSTRHIRPGELVAVVVASASLVAPSLERLGWAPLELVENEAGLGNEPS